MPVALARGYPTTFWICSFPLRIPFVCSALLLATVPATVSSQDEAVVSAIARVLSLEDSRRFDPWLIDAARHPEPTVRRRAALALGRIGDPAGVPALLELLDDAVSGIRTDAAFALGVLADPSAFGRLRELVLQTPPDRHGPTEAEAVAAICRMGGRDAAEFIDRLLTRWSGRTSSGDAAPPTVVRALREAWRLGDEAPITALLQYGESPVLALRTGAIYSLSRLGAKEAAPLFMRMVDDQDAQVRSLAARALTAEYSDSAGLERAGTARWITPLVDDPDPRVRINTLRSLGTYRDAALTAVISGALNDQDAGVRVQGLAALGSIGGAEAVSILERNLSQGPLEMRRQALLGLARSARNQALVQCAGWITAESWIHRAIGADALREIGGDTATAWLDAMTSDPDGRVAARALGALARLDSARARVKARALAAHADPVVRAVAVGQIAGAPTREDIGTLVDAFSMAPSDPAGEVRIAVVRALGALAEEGFSQRTAIEDQFLRRYPEMRDYLVRRAAIEYFPAAAAQWGSERPIETGRTLDDYRDIARRLVLPAELSGESPGLVVETERGRVMIRLFASDAPLAVDAFLRLADRHYFDGGSWHRVVPNFVIQAGDPRGDGWGGPGFALRDEVSRRPYDRGTVGLALAGPDTGGSQFFVAVSSQPHLEGTYPVLGYVDGGMEVVDRITQGDRIRTIRRR